MKLLRDYILLKDVTDSSFTETGLEIPVDVKELPTGKIIMVAEDVKEIASPGDFCHYILPREKGKCKYNGEEHYLVPISSVVAIL